MKDLLFFGTEGNNLNFYLNEATQKYEGKLIFDHNSSDTFKTYGLYLFERIQAFEYQDKSNLWLDKFQLFNEYGFNFYANKNLLKPVTKIEAVNNDSTFFSKWIYGNNFDAYYPIGSMIRFDSTIAEFNNYNQFYQVISVKRNAILIISNVDNQTFNTLYQASLNTPSVYSNMTISGGYLLSLLNYITPSLDSTFSNWSEPKFYTKLFNNQKLSIVNSSINSGVRTLKEKNIIDHISNKYRIDYDSYTGGNLIIELKLKTDLPLIYNGGLNFNGNRIDFLSTIPTYLKPGIEFQVLNSISNTNFLTVSPISIFNPLTTYAIGNQVIFNNITYECTQNYSTSDVNSVYPTNTAFWSSPTYVIVDESLVLEFLVGGQLYLTTNTLYFNYPFTVNNQVTFYSAVQKYTSDFSLFNVDLVYEKGDKIVAYLNLVGDYASVNFYDGSLSNNITITENKYIRNLELVEEVKAESNMNISSNYERLIQINDLDDFGINVSINGQNYYQATLFVSNGIDVDLPKTIDDTIKSWYSSYFITLLKLGIVVDLVYFGPGSSLLFNTIRFRSVYPNVSMSINISVGTTASFRIAHSALSIVDMGGVFILNINDRPYLEKFNTDINTTLNNWKNQYNELLGYNEIEVDIEGNTIFFYTQTDSTKINYIVSVGKTAQPGDDLYIIRNYKLGNTGLLITANQIISSSLTASFENSGFATGMITNLLNSDYPLNNHEYNIIYLDPDKMTLSYQGPFWGNTNSTSYGAYSAWSFNESSFGYDINATYSLSSPVIQSFSVSSVLGYGYDLVYNSQDNSIISSYEDFRWTEVDINNVYTTYGLTTSVTYSSTIKQNRYNGLQYILYTSASSEQIWRLDTLANKMSILASHSSIDSYAINQQNGDCYVGRSGVIDIYDTSGTQILPSISTNALYLGYSDSENNFYSSDGTNIKQISGDTRAITSTIAQSVSSDFYYNQINNTLYFGSSNLFSLKNAVATPITSVVGNPTDYDVNPYDGLMYVSSNNNLYVLDNANNLVNQFGGLSSNGHVAFSHFDRNIYYFGNSNLLVFDNNSASIVATISIAGSVSNTAYNYSRNSIYGLYSSNNGIFEVTSTLPYFGFTTSGVLTYSVLNSNNFGNLSPDYTQPEDLLLKTREFIRKPRYGFETANDNQVSYKWQWQSDNVPELMLIDFSGDQLAKTGSYVYTGIKPLDDVRLNRNPNTDISKINESKYQQTVFNEVETKLDYIDSSTDITFEPEPLTLFMAFNSDTEGVVQSTLLLKEVEDINFSILGSPTNSNVINFSDYTDPITGDNYGIIKLDPNSTDVFLDRNLKQKQVLKIIIKDVTNLKKQYVSSNTAKIFSIRNIGSREIIVDYINGVKLVSESNKVTNYPTNNVTTYTQVTFDIQEKEIGVIQVYGQTEIEDIRYKIELNNVGHNLYPEDAYIFKDYPIEEVGIDWHYLNNKRKEMLLIKNDIFNYVGSYKALINAINLFGYNDLELYEYYRNVNMTSSQFGKLFKVEIPDIFDNSVPGWNQNDYFSGDFNNPNYEVTNLFNLTYRITDKEGNFLLSYSIDEIVKKLSGLKNWMSKNVVPITHKIMDITGRADFVNNNYIFHDSYDINILNQRSGLTPVVGDINEAYVLPINSGSTVYNIVLDPSYQVNDTGSLPDYYTILIKTYQTYPEWNAFKTYTLGEYVRYFDELYVSVLSQNRLNNPRKLRNSPSWNSNNSYLYGQIISYEDRFYRYLVINPVATYQQESLSIGNNPYGLVVANDKIYVTIELEDKVKIINGSDFTISTTVISVGTAPTKLLLNATNGYVYVMTTTGVTVINPLDDTIITTITTGIDIPFDIAINNNSGKLYLSTSNNDIRVYDSSLILVTTLLFSNPLTNLVWADTLDKIYIYDSVASQVIVINSNTDLTLLPISTTMGNKSLFNNIDGFLYYVNGSNFLYKTTSSPFTYLVYNTAAVVDFIVDPNSGNVYVSNVSDQLIQISTGGIILNTWNIGVNGKLTIDTFSGDVYVSDSASNQLVIFSYINGSIKSTINLSDSVFDMIFDNSRNSLYGIISTTDEIFSIKLKNNSEPPFGNSDWNDITEWQLVPYKPVQTIKEFRKITDLSPFNFTVDSNIDPYVLTQVTSENGYGQNYTDRKSYEIYISEDGVSKIVSTDPVQDSNP